MKKDKKPVNEAPKRIIAGIPEAAEIEKSGKTKRRLKRSEIKNLRNIIIAAISALVIIAATVASFFVAHALHNHCIGGSLRALECSAHVIFGK